MMLLLSFGFAIDSSRSGFVLLFTTLLLGSDVTVVAFLIFPTQTNSFNVESLKVRQS